MSRGGTSGHGLVVMEVLGGRLHLMISEVFGKTDVVSNTPKQPEQQTLLPVGGHPAPGHLALQHYNKRPAQSLAEAPLEPGWAVQKQCQLAEVAWFRLTLLLLTTQLWPSMIQSCP